MNSAGLEEITSFDKRNVGTPSIKILFLGLVNLSLKVMFEHTKTPKNGKSKI